MEGKEKYTVSADFTKSTHGLLGCITCHGGKNVDDMNAAHAGYIKDPSDPSNATDKTKVGGICAACHTKTAQTASTSMHYNLNGMRNALDTFSGVKNVSVDKNHALSAAYANNCNNCHASCGQCHVSRPKVQTGGLLSQHNFQKTPPMENTCNLCHSTRNGVDFVGAENTPDVHYTKTNPKTKKTFVCTDCHPKNNFHGDGKAEDIAAGKAEAANMHQLDTLPKCADCHTDSLAGKTSKSKEMHNAHPKGTLSCQVCHTQATTSCSNCHTPVTKDKDGKVIKVASDSKPYQLFKIGLNPNPKNSIDPEKYVALRHIPTTADTFNELGEKLLPNYDKVANWKVSPTHNIQKNTPQNSSCNSCHGVDYLFLTAKDLLPDDSKANEQLLVHKIPAKNPSSK